jgi:hypothetical protein
MFKPPVNLTRNLGLTSTLYFIESGEFVKVGIAEDLGRRLFTLQLGNPLVLKVGARRTIPRPLQRQVERLVHQALSEWSIGREWFRLSAKNAVRLADPIVKKANVTAYKWRVGGIELGTGWGLDRDDVADHTDRNQEKFSPV